MLAAIRATYRAAVDKLGVENDTTDGLTVRVAKRKVLHQKGFTEMAKRRPNGAQFYKLGRTSEEVRQPWDNVRDKVAKWTKVGKTTDKGVQPTHAWSHRFQALCRKHAIKMEYANAIKGHAEPSAAAGYGEIPLEACRDIEGLSTCRRH